MMPSRVLLRVIAVASLASGAAASVDFSREIQPILAEACTACHGHDEQKGGLRLDRRESAVAEREGVRAIVPGHPDKSDLIARILSDDPDEVMPPPKSKKRITEKQRQLLRQWISEGAEFQPHWAFAPVPAVVPVPEVAGARQPIDAFVRAQLAARKLAPSPEADRRTLIRRLTLDLLGLPPTPAEVDAFVGDASPEAYDRLVDRLLASPHFGERWGRHWLDAARYADSDGYEKDVVRPYAYLFRDWVIEATNSDMPFDRFTVEQLAGDLLPAATDAQKVATAFHRQTLTNREGGVDREEFRCKATVDRASTTGTVWLGLTVGCAECHTHKYDPISHREFYQFYAFFNRASEKDIPMPSADEKAAHAKALATWEAAHTKLKEPLQAYLRGEALAKVSAWEQTLQLPRERWQVLIPERVSASVEGAEEQFTAQPDGTIHARDKDGVRTRYRVAVSLPAGTRGLRLEAEPEAGKGVGAAKDGDFGLSEIYVTTERAGVAEGEQAQRLPWARAAASFSAAGKDIALAVDRDRTTQWSVAGRTKERQVAVFELARPLDASAATEAQVHLEFYTTGVMQQFRLSATVQEGPFTQSVIPDEIRAVADLPGVFRSPAQAAKLAEYYATFHDPDAKRLQESLSAHLAKKPVFKPTVAAVMVPESRKTHIHLRGDFLQKGEEVAPGVPAFLPPLQPRGATADRLDLARWLVRRDHPLTSRVAVNHVWRHLFGRGLVATENDFGTRGELPSHPALLDWLAAAFSTHAADAPPGMPGLGWSRKGLIRLIVSSDTYKQSSHWRADVAEHDALNTLLARQGRFRLEAEVVRDVNLAVSGLLHMKIGGPSIKPPLSPDLAALSYAGGLKWTETTGPERYRRGLYIHLQRTVLYPMLATFDAPTTSVTCTRRERSNTPLQALTLLNNETSWEAARALGDRMSRITGPVTEQLRSGFTLVTARPPDADELKSFHAFYDRMQLEFERDPSAANQFAAVEKGKSATPAHAALIASARVLLNLDESITRE